MNQRRPGPWVWTLATIVLLVIVAVAAYWAGTLHGQPVAMRPRSFVMGHPLLGGLGFWLIVLAVALVVGLLVAALWPSSRRSETYEEWHRRQQAAGPPAAPTAAPPAAPTAAPPADVATTPATPDDHLPPG